MQDVIAVRRSAIGSVGVIAAGLSVLGYAVATDSAGLPLAVMGLFGLTLMVSHRSLLTWESVLGALVLIILFIPIKRYGLPVSGPVDMEPYRLVVALIFFGWTASLLVDPSVRLRAGAFGVPMAAVFFFAAASDAVNPGRVAGVPSGGSVVKSISFLASFVLVYFLVVSVVRTRRAVDALVKVIVAGGAAVAVGAMIESRTQINVFDRLAGSIPMLSYRPPPAGDTEALAREGTERVFASAQHPIALAAALAMLVPLGLYLAMTPRPRRAVWWGATALLVMGTVATVSRTGVLMVVVFALVLVLLRPRAMRKLLPYALPAIVVVMIALPHTLGSLYGSIFGGGLHGALAEQSNEVQYAELTSSGRIADIGPTLAEVSQEPLLGEGYGTRVAGVNARLLDDQWLGTLAETGVLGLLAWLAVFRRSIGRLARTARRDRSERGWLCAALAASIASFGAGMLTYDAFSFIQVTFLLFILLALAAATLAETP